MEELIFWQIRLAGNLRKEEILGSNKQRVKHQFAVKMASIHYAA